MIEHIQDIRDNLDAIEKELNSVYMVPYDTLISLLEYFDDRADVNSDGDGPNKAMQFQTEIKRILGEI